MAFTRSTTGCFACKAKRKKCDETKPSCVRCQKAGHECSGYTYIQDPSRPKRKLRTLLAPRTRRSQSRATDQQEILLKNTEELGPQLQTPLPLDYNLATSGASYNKPDIPAGVNDTSDAWVSLSPSTASNPNLGPALPSPSTRTVTPVTSSQTSLWATLLSLSYPTGMEPSLQPVQSIANFPPDPSALLGSNWSPTDTEKYSASCSTTYGGAELEDVANMIYRQPALDRTAENNGLPFVLQSYATWVRRMAFDPLKVAGIARDFVFSQFEGGGQSRWILALLGNIGSRIGSAQYAEGQQKSMLSALQTAVRWRLGAVKSHPHPGKVELAKALESTLETIIMHFFVSPISEAMILRQEAGPIFQLLYSELPNVHVDLPSLLYHPLGCLRHYAHVDILFSVVTDIPTSFRYEVPIGGNQPTDPSQIVLATRSDCVFQWVYGISSQILVVFSKMKLVRHDGLMPNSRTVASLEQEISELQPFGGSLSERFLTVMFCVVQECWRQVAFVYLYMAVCGDPCDTPRVRKVLKQYMDLLKGIKPGRVPDEFLIMTFLLISPAAQRKVDREVIKQRFLGLYTHGRSFHVNDSFIYVIEDYWARANTEGRPVVWSDVGLSRKRILGV